LLPISNSKKFVEDIKKINALNIMSVKILMVCLGNICHHLWLRGILASKLPPTKFTVNSTGTEISTLATLDARSITAAKNHNLDISNQKRQFTLRFRDMITFAVDQSNYKNVLNLAKMRNTKTGANLK
jgi:protein-tyrosine phosphatase